jgi:hypothetical protein
MMARSACRSGGMVDDMGNPVLAEAGGHPALRLTRSPAPRASGGLNLRPDARAFFASIGSDPGQADDMEERMRLYEQRRWVEWPRTFLWGVSLGIVISAASDFGVFVQILWGRVFG